jgi:hypothetical protein
MKIKKVVVSEGGIELLSPTDGVILQGVMFSSDIEEDGTPHGGLFGDGPTAESMANAEVPYRAYSWKELLDGLDIDPQVLMNYAQQKMGTPRGPVGNATNTHPPTPMMGR